MSSVGQSTVSNDVLQSRYQKSLKQIDKLIQVNRQMKEKERELQDQFQLLEQEYSNLLMRYTELSANKLQPGHKMEINTQKQVQLSSDELKRKQSTNKQQSIANQQVRERNDQRASSKQADEKTATVIERLEHQVTELQMKNELLQAQNTVIQKELAENQSNLIKMTIKYTKVEEQLKILQQQKPSTITLEKTIQMLRPPSGKDEVFSYSDRIEQLLDAKYDKLQVKHLLAPQKRRIKALQLENKTYEQKIMLMKLNSKKDHKQIELYQQKIKAFEKLTEKQQSQIAKIIEVYDVEFRKASHKFDVSKESMKKKVVEINQELQVLRNELKRTKTEQQGSLRESPCNKLKRDISLDVDIGETKPLKSETPKALNCSQKLNSNIEFFSNSATRPKDSQIHQNYLYVNGRPYSISRDEMNMDIGGVQNWQADKIDKKQLKKTLNSNHSSVKYISKVNIVHDYHIRVGDGK